MSSFQSTLPAREATQDERIFYLFRRISIHASRGGSDFRASIPIFNHFKFQSTLPAREATGEVRIIAKCRNFNPRFTRGKRPVASALAPYTIPFQSTLPAGEATTVEKKAAVSPAISIHASRGGSDSVKRGWQGFYALFQSTLSAGKATSGLQATAQYLSISIHASREGSDQWCEHSCGHT